MKRIALTLAFALSAFAAGPPNMPAPRLVWTGDVGFQSTFQPTMYGAALVSPSGSGTDWTPGTGTGGAAVQPNTYVGLLVCSANCSNPYGQTWVPATSLGGGSGSGTVSPSSSAGPNVYGNTTSGSNTVAPLTSSQIASAIGSAPVQNASSVPASGVTGSTVPLTTAPSSGQILVGNSGGTAYAPQTLSGDSTLTSGGVMTNTTATNIRNGSLGSIPYQSGVSTTAQLAGNTTTTKQFLTQIGNGTASAAPAWGAIGQGDISPLLQSGIATDATANPSYAYTVTSTNSGITNGITAGFNCLILRTYAAAGYTGTAICNQPAPNQYTQIYRTTATALNTANWQNSIYIDASANPTFMGAFTTFNGQTTANGSSLAPQFVVTGGTPTIAAGAAAGTSPTVSVTGNNQDQVVSITTGTATTTGTLATITFSGTKASADKGCQISARNANAAPTMTSVYTGTPSTTTYTISAATGLTASTAYQWTLHCQ